MLVGTDVSIEVCKNEGYLYVNFNTKEFKKDKEYRVMRKFPIWDELKGQYHTDVFISWNDVVELYLEDKNSIDEFAETCNYVDFENPTIEDFVNLCSDVSSYKGL